MNKQTFYAVVVLPEEESQLPGTQLGNENTFGTYDEAFADLVHDVNNPPKQPKGEQPVRIEGLGFAKELWIITRGTLN